MPRHVILEHDHPHLHWDFMLEAEGLLRTWRLAAPPTGPGRIAAVPLSGHRLAYLDYEGPVSGGRGRVVRWDAGTFTWLVDTPEQLEVELHGRRFQGVARRLAGEETYWIFSALPSKRADCP